MAVTCHMTRYSAGRYVLQQSSVMGKWLNIIEILLQSLSSIILSHLPIIQSCSIVLGHTAYSKTKSYQDPEIFQPVPVLQYWAGPVLSRIRSSGSTGLYTKKYSKLCVLGFNWSCYTLTPIYTCLVFNYLSVIMSCTTPPFYLTFDAGRLRLFKKITNTKTM